MNDTMVASDTRPYSTRSIVLFALAAALGSLLLTLFFFWLQAPDRKEHIAGRIVSHTADQIIIADSRGATTTILITPTTHYKTDRSGPGTDTFTPGTGIMAVGTFLAPRTFVADGIGSLKHRPE